MGHVGSVLFYEARYADAEKMLRQALDIEDRIWGEDPPETLKTLTAELHNYGPENPDTLSSRTDLAETLIREGRYSEAERLAGESLEIQRRTLGPRHPDMLDSLQQLATAMAFNHHYAEASKLFRDAIDKGNNFTGQGKPWTAWFHFACMAAITKHSDDALQYLAKAINRGFKNADRLLTDEDLKNLHGNPRFQQLVAELKANAPSVQAK
jgi:tetratricopeptide (TPR) repeat protein